MAWQLRSLRPGDEDWITEACQDPDTQRWTMVPRPYTRAHAEEFVASGGDELHLWAIVDDDNDRHDNDRGLGMIGIHVIDPATGDADTGYWVAPWARRQGVVTWALGEVVQRARAIEGVRAVTLQIAESNVASRGAAERAGFTLIGPTGGECPDGECTAPTLLFRFAL